MVDALTTKSPAQPGVLFKDFRGFGSEARGLIVATVLEGVVGSFVWFLFTLYLEVVGYDPSRIGIVLMLHGTMSTLPLLPAGYLGDRFGRKRMIVVGVLLKAAGILTVIFAGSYESFCLGGSLLGLGYSFYGPAFLALMSEKVDDKRRKYLFSLQSFAGMVSGAVAILVSGLLPGIISAEYELPLREGFRLTFWIGLVFAISELFVIAPITETRKYGLREAGKEEGKDEGKRRGKGEGIGKGRIDDTRGEGARPPIPWRTIALLCTPMALLGIGAGLIVPFFQLYFVWRFDTPIDVIGMLFSLTHLFWGIAYLIMPYFADRVGSVRAITTVQWVAILALIGIPISPTFHFVALMYLIRMVVMNSTWPILQSYSIGQVPKEHSSFTLSSTNFSFNVPKGLSPGIAGFIFEYNLELPFFICAAFYIVATIIFFAAFRGRDDRGAAGSDDGPPGSEEEEE